MKKYRLMVKEVVQETPDTITIVFAQPANDTITYQSGQFLTLIFKIGGKDVRRAYSLCSAMATDQDLAVTIKRVEGGLVSNFLNDSIATGNEIEILSPAGNFTPEINANTQQHFVFFAGGSGITPLMSMLKTALFTAPKSKVTLVYTSRYEENIIFKNQLDQFTQQFPDRLNVVYNLSQPSASWNGLKGRLDFDKIREILSQIPKEDEKSYWTCGPDGMMEIVERSLKALGIEQVYKESFTVSVEEASKEKGAVSTETQKVTVHYAGETYEFEVKPNQTILDAAMEIDIDLPYSCQSGLCTACMGKCVSGSIALEEDDCLTDDELKEGFVLTCVAYPTSPNVVIEID